MRSSSKWDLPSDTCQTPRGQVTVTVAAEVRRITTLTRQNSSASKAPRTKPPLPSPTPTTRPGPPSTSSRDSRQGVKKKQWQPAFTPLPRAWWLITTNRLIRSIRAKWLMNQTGTQVLTKQCLLSYLLNSEIRLCGIGPNWERSTQPKAAPSPSSHPGELSSIRRPVVFAYRENKQTSKQLPALTREMVSFLYRPGVLGFLTDCCGVWWWADGLCVGVCWGSDPGALLCWRGRRGLWMGAEDSSRASSAGCRTRASELRLSPGSHPDAAAETDLD